MGSCFFKTPPNTHPQPPTTHISQPTTSKLKPTHPNTYPYLQRPPKLAQMLEIETFQQATIKGGSKLHPKYNRRNSLQEFLKNDSVSIFLGSQNHQSPNQVPQRQSKGEAERSRDKDKHNYGQQAAENNRNNKRERELGNNTTNLGGHLQTQILPQQLTLTTFYLP